MSTHNDSSKQNGFYLSSETLKLWGTSSFKRALLDEICANEQALPLEIMCRSGGLPMEKTLRIKKVNLGRMESTLVEGTLEISFNELIAAGCADIERQDELHGEIFFTLHLQDGLLETSASDLYLQTGE